MDDEKGFSALVALRVDGGSDSDAAKSNLIEISSARLFLATSSQFHSLSRGRCNEIGQRSQFNR